MTNELPQIVLAGNAPQEQCRMLNAMLSEEELADICGITLYGAEGQPEAEALKDAVEDYADGQVQGVVCLPFATPHVDVLKEFLAEDANAIFNLFVNSRMKMASVLGNVESVSDDAPVTVQAIVTRGIQVAKALKRDFMIQNPRLAILAMPGAPAGTDSEEDTDIVALAVGELQKEGIQAFGPVDRAGFFSPDMYQEYDVLIEAFDGQCMPEFEAMADGSPLTLIAGVDAPVVASPYDGVLHAIYLAIDVERHRREYDAPFANPLPKLYKERREDGDKARFAVKKKGFNPAEHRRENVNYTTIAKPKA